ncbi:MAG: type IV pilus twitching motility protein PilT [Planctomycetes bacterium]|nr:type IV pilus twitching motility protein PilT [Planctomycetota bacterium]
MVQINQLLDLIIEKGGSDLLLTVGRPPVMRVGARLRAINTPPLTPDETQSLMKSITLDRFQQQVDEEGSADFAFAFGDKARFRVSAFRQKGYIAMVLRVIPSKLLTFEQIGLPENVKNLLTRPRGIILVTGPTGSGKTTTLATCVDFINTEMEKHIITLEDPIEYYHNHKRCVITQREIGVDTTNFKEGIRRALRQNPDVILVGEMRDLDTIEAAITAAETGHLVMATLHTTGAARTVDRIIDAFPTNQQEQIRTQLSSSIVAVISQTLLATLSGTGRVAAYEIMIMNSAIENLIRKNETFRVNDQIKMARRQGMILLDDHLFQLFIQKKISYADMIQKSQSPEDLQLKVKEYTRRQERQEE